jgi:predicted RNA-binding protein with PIN domain
VTSDEPVVLVDARNVMRSRWPNIPEERFVDLTRAWAEQGEVRIVAVFDGRAPGERTGVHELDERTTIVGTGRETADDWIAEHARELVQDGNRLWLVSSDRGLRERVTGYVERMIGGGSFAGRLEAPDRDRNAPS